MDQTSGIPQAQQYNEMVSAGPPSDLSIINRLEKLPRGSKVLDLGCGTGNITFMLADTFGSEVKVVGVDPDGERIEIAKQANKYSNVSFAVGDGENFPEDVYDLIFTNYVMLLIKDKEVVFHKVRPSLRRPGGKFLIITPVRPPDAAHEITALMGPSGVDAVKEIFHPEPVEFYDKLAISCGFDVTLKEEGIDRKTHADPETALNAWMGITHGKFDPTKVDPKALEDFKQKYSGQQMEWEIPVVRYVFTLK